MLHFYKRKMMNKIEFYQEVERRLIDLLELYGEQRGKHWLDADHHFALRHFVQEHEALKGIFERLFVPDI